MLTLAALPDLMRDVMAIRAALAGREESAS